MSWVVILQLASIWDLIVPCFGNLLLFFFYFFISFVFFCWLSRNDQTYKILARKIKKAVILCLVLGTNERKERTCLNGSFFLKVGLSLFLTFSLIDLNFYWKSKKYNSRLSSSPHIQSSLSTRWIFISILL